MSGAARRILLCWLVLLALLAITTAVAFVPLGDWNFPIAITIAVAKAALVLAIFMELRAARGLVRGFALAGFVWLLVMIMLTAADYMHRTDVKAPIDRPTPID